jgi:hypothetical protein
MSLTEALGLCEVCRFELERDPEALFVRWEPLYVSWELCCRCLSGRKVTGKLTYYRRTRDDRELMRQEWEP